eukprot:758546-Hanusia_phi.AAC.1
MQGVCPNDAYLANEQVWTAREVFLARSRSCRKGGNPLSSCPDLILERFPCLNAEAQGNAKL